jgi:uncharacterized membrane protein
MDQQKNFSIKESIIEAYSLTKDNFLFFVKILFFILILNIIFSLLIDFLFTKNNLLKNIFNLLFSIFIEIGFIVISLKIYNKQKVEFNELFLNYKYFLNYFLAKMIYFILIFLGFILLIIPGIIIGLRLQFFNYLIFEKNFNIIESFKTSWKITKGSTLKLFLLSIILTLINLLGLLFFLIGLFFTIPLTRLISISVYKKLSLNNV